MAAKYDRIMKSLGRTHLYEAIIAERRAREALKADMKRRRKRKGRQKALGAKVSHVAAPHPVPLPVKTGRGKGRAAR